MSSQATATPHLALADRHDCAGRHDDAINELALGTQAGDLTCMRQLAKRLLSGDRAPSLPAEGARFLQDAATQGDAEAAARMAALTVLGFYVTPSWNDALRWLVVAADRNWEPARTQLTALAGMETPSSVGNPCGDYWGNLASRIDFSGWQEGPPARELSADPQIRVFDSLLSRQVCDWIMERASSRLTRALVYDAVSKRDIVGETRTNRVANFSLADVEILDVLVQIRMSWASQIPMNHMEAPAVLHYAVGEESTNHYDFVDPAVPDYADEIARNGQRIATFLIYLNEDYDGGATDFPTLGVCHKGQRGQGLLFINALPDLQPDLRMLHAGRSPTRGEKWIVSQFVRSRPLLTALPPRT
ncbi:MAG TPA: 2OG-Fe(II) oxygenase [Steroidobacteraceae bacterium]|jgi:hypothetical protein